MHRHNPPFELKEFKIEVTHRCNLNCIHCSSDARPSNLLEMQRDDCLRILDEAARMGAQDVAFSGGEPILWPHIYDAADAATKHHLKTTIYTSGIVETFRQRASRLSGLGVSRFIFSIFGATGESHERITRRSGSFERTKTAVRDALDFGLATEFHFVPISANYQELRDITLLAHQLGVSRVSVLRLVPQGRATLIRNRVLSRVQNLELRRLILDLRKEYGDDFVRTGSPYNFLMLNDTPACSAAIDRLIIGPDLRIYPCDAFKNISASELEKDEEFSRLAGTSLKACWVKSAYLNAVRTYLTTDFMPPCDSCGLLVGCLSGCLAQKVITHKSIDKRPDPDCMRNTFRGELG